MRTRWDMAAGWPEGREVLRARVVGNPVRWADDEPGAFSLATTEVVGAVACVAMSVIAARTPSLTAEATSATNVHGATAGNSRAPAGLPYGVARS